MRRIAALSFLLLSGPGLSDEAGEYAPSPELIETWAADWHRRMDRLASDLMQSYEEALFLRLAPDEQPLARQEIRDAVDVTLSWDTHSAKLIGRLTERCGVELLQTIEPYARAKDFSTVDERTIRQYAGCYGDVVLSAEAGVMYAVMGDAELKQLLARYQSRVSGSYQRIAPVITTSSVEREYGELLESVVSLYDVADADARDREAVRLKREFAEDPAVLEVSFEDRESIEPVFLYRRPGVQQPGQRSCRGRSPPEQQGLSRCTWHDVGLGQDTVIRYTRPPDPYPRQLRFVIAFDYAELVNALSNQEAK